MIHRAYITATGEGGAQLSSGECAHTAGSNPHNKQGYSVWTDGEIIYGNHRCAGGADLIPPASGVPVLSGKLRGYYDATGKYKDFPIGVGGVLVNTDTLYVPFYEAEYTLDADLSPDGKLYIIQDGSYYECLSNELKIENVEWSYHGAVVSDGVFWTTDYEDCCIEDDNNGEISYGEWRPASEDPLILNEGRKPFTTDRTMKISKDGKVIQELSVKPYAKDAVYQLSRVAPEMAARLGMKGGDVIPGSPNPPGEFIPSDCSAYVSNAKIFPDGRWWMLVLAYASGYCFPWQTFWRGEFKRTFRSRSIRVDNGATDLGVLGMDAPAIAFWDRYSEYERSHTCTIHPYSEWYAADISVSCAYLVSSDGSARTLRISYGMPEPKESYRDEWVSGDKLEDYKSWYKSTWFFAPIDSGGTSLGGRKLITRTVKLKNRPLEDIGDGRMDVPIGNGYSMVTSLTDDSVHCIYGPKGELVTDKHLFSPFSNVCACKLSHGKYLVGAHRGSLFFVQNGRYSNVDWSSLRNYRLCFMKQIGLAKGE